MEERQGEARGFTLIELIVVLVILAGLAAVVYPRYDLVFARVRSLFERSELERQLLALPEKVRRSGRGGILITQSADQLPDSTVFNVAGAPQAGNPMEQWQVLRLPLPPGWRMRVIEPVFYHFSGACEGGEVTFGLAAIAMRYRLYPPLCRPVPIIDQR